jgi:hypothetical protein
MKGMGVALVGLFLLGQGTNTISKVKDGQSTDPQMTVLSPKETLKNARGMTVQVGSLDELKYQLTPDTIRNAVELKLREAGVTVMPSDSKSSSLLPILYVNVTVMHVLPDRGYAYFSHISYEQPAELYGIDKTTRTFAFAQTWGTGTIGVIPPSGANAIRATIMDQVTEFLNNDLDINSHKVTPRSAPTGDKLPAS